MFKEIPSKLGKINDWYINRMGTKKGRKEKGAPDEEIIFVEDESGWESDNSEVERGALRKNLKKEEAKTIEQRGNDRSCGRKGKEANDNLIQVPSQGEICETNGTTDSISFEDVRCDDVSDSVSDDQQSNMSLNRYMRTFKKKSSNLERIWYTDNSECIDCWREAIGGKSDLRYMRWEAASDDSTKSHQQKNAEFPCGKEIRSKKVRELLELDSLFGSICSDMTEASEEYVLVEEFEHEGETEQYKAQKYQQIQLQGHHLVCTSPDKQPKKSIHRMESINHIREGSIQSRAFSNHNHIREGSVRSRTMNPTKQSSDSERKQMIEQHREQRWREGHEHYSFPMSVIQTNKQNRMRNQTIRNRMSRTNEKLKHLSQWKKMEGEKRPTRSLPPIRIRNKKSGNGNFDLIRHHYNQNNIKFSEPSVSVPEKDLQHGMTSGYGNESNREKIKCDVTEKMNMSKNWDDVKCPNTYPVVCPINYSVYLNKKHDQS